MAQQTAFDIYPEGSPVWALFDNIWYPCVIPSVDSLGDAGLEGLYNSVIGDDELDIEQRIEFKRSHIPVYFLKDQTCSLFNVKDIRHFSMDDKDKIEKEEIKEELACLLDYINVADDGKNAREHFDSSADDDNKNEAEDESELLLGYEHADTFDDRNRRKREEKAQKKIEKREKKKKKRDKRMKIEREDSRHDEETQGDTDSDRQDSPDDNEDHHSELSGGLAHVGWKDINRTNHGSGSRLGLGADAAILLSQSDIVLGRLNNMGSQRSKNHEFQTLKNYYHNVAAYAAADNGSNVMPIYECDFLRSAVRALEKRQRLAAYLRASEKRATDTDAKILITDLEKKANSYSVEDAFTTTMPVGSSEFKNAVLQEKIDVSNKVGVEIAVEKKKHAIGIASDAVDLHPVSKPVDLIGATNSDLEKLKKVTHFQYLDPGLNPLAATNGDVIAVEITPFAVGEGLERERIAAEKERIETAKMNQALRDGFGVSDLPMDDEIELTRMVAPRLRASGVDTSFLSISSNSTTRLGGHSNLQTVTQGAVSTFSDPFAKRIEGVVSLSSLGSQRHIDRMSSGIMSKWHAFRDLHPAPTQDLQRILPNGNGISACFDEERMRLAEKARAKALHHLSKEPDIAKQQQLKERSSGIIGTQNLVAETILSQILSGRAATTGTYDNQDEKFFDQSLLRNTTSQLTDTGCSNNLMSFGSLAHLSQPGRGSTMTDFTRLQQPRRRAVPKPGHPDQVEMQSVYSVDSENSILAGGALYTEDHMNLTPSNVVRGESTANHPPVWDDGVSTVRDMLLTREGIIALANTQGAQITEDDLHAPIHFGYHPSEVYRSGNYSGAVDPAVKADSVDVGSVMSKGLYDSERYGLKSEIPNSGDQIGGGFNGLSADADDGHVSKDDMNSQGSIQHSIDEQNPPEVLLKTLIMEDVKSLDRKISRLLKDVERRKKAAEDAGIELTTIRGEQFFISFTDTTSRTSIRGACFPASQLHKVLEFLRTPWKLKKVVKDISERCLTEKRKMIRAAGRDDSGAHSGDHQIIFLEVERKQIKNAFRQKIERLFSLSKGALSTPYDSPSLQMKMNETPNILYTKVIDAVVAAKLYTNADGLSEAVTLQQQSYIDGTSFSSSHSEKDVQLLSHNNNRRPRDKIYGLDHE